ncbi:MAG: hypothetical protein JW772_02805 [Candidatus Diapherotrites archaeon]|nr:hypothetical protein [Candidatus Diapherotrites archaeon]
MRVGFALLLLALLLCSGCLSQELSEDARFACIDLSSQAYAFVPECETQEKCFEKANAELFDFDSAVFSSQVREKIFYYKNNLALSWLYFNKVRENLKEINRVCSSRSDTAVLARAVNELNHNLISAFIYSDNASKISFEILILEQADLEHEKIELIKEEQLFNDYVLLKQNVNDLQSGNNSSNTFASYYLRQMNDLESLMQQTGFSKTFIDEITPLDFLEKYDSEILKEADLEQSLEIPFLTPILDSFVSFLNTFFRMSSASHALERMPAFGFLQAYNNLAGFENSAAKRFAALLQSNALHRKQLVESNFSIETSVSQKIQIAESKISEISEKDFAGFDSNFFSSLHFLLGQDSSIATQKFSIQDFSNFRENALQELLPLKTEFYALQQSSFTNSVSLGERTLKLKELESGAETLLANLGYLDYETIQGLDLLCRERLNRISDFLLEQEFPDNVLLRIADLKARILFKANSFDNSDSFGERLLLCRRALEEFNDFKLAFNDYEEYGIQNEIFVSDCFDFMERLFSVNSEIGLSDFRLRFEKIRALAESRPDIQTLYSSCSALKEDTLSFLNNNYRVLKLKESFSNTRELLGNLELIDLYSEAIVSDSALDSFSSRLGKLAKYFVSGELDFVKLLPLLSELEDTLFSLEAELSENFGRAVAEFVSQNHVFDGDSNSMKLILSNPFGETERVVLKIPVPENLSEFQLPEDFFVSNENLVIDLNSLPLGGFAFEFPSKKQGLPAQDLNYSLQEEIVSDSALKSTAENALDRISTFSNLLADGLPKKFSKLFALLESVPEDTLFGLNYVLPLSLERLSKLELQSDSLESESLREKFKIFGNFFNESNFEAALGEFGAFEKELEKKEIEAKSIGAELDSALSSMQEDAVAALASAEAFLDSKPFSEESADLLAKAKSEYRKENFLKAIAFANAASEILNQANSNPDALIYFYPIIIGIALVFLVRYKKKQLSEKKEQLRRIVRKARGA